MRTAWSGAVFVSMVVALMTGCSESAPDVGSPAPQGQPSQDDPTGTLRTDPTKKAHRDSPFWAYGNSAYEANCGPSVFSGGVEHREVVKGETVRGNRVCIDLHGASVVNSNFLGTKLALSMFEDARLRDVRFTNADMLGAFFDGASLTRVTFTDVNLKDVSFENVQTQGVTFTQTICPNGRMSEDQGGSCL